MPGPKRELVERAGKRSRASGGRFPLVLAKLIDTEIMELQPLTSLAL